MRVYAHYDDDVGSAPAHTEAMSFDCAADVSFELLRVMFVDAYNAKRAPARLDPYALAVVTDELGAARYPLGGSIFDSLNEGDDVFFSSGGGSGASAAAASPPPAAAAAAMPLEFQIAALKDEIKRATDDGEYDKLAPLATEIKELEAQQQASEAQRVRAAAGPRSAVGPPLARAQPRQAQCPVTQTQRKEQCSPPPLVSASGRGSTAARSAHALTESCDTRAGPTCTSRAAYRYAPYRRSAHLLRPSSSSDRTA